MSKFRTHTCGELTSKHVDQVVKLSGWVLSRRDHGGIVFIDLRDRYGITQVAFDPDHNQEAWKEANTLRNEFVLTIEGKVRLRPAGQANSNLFTGEIEIITDSITIHNKSKTPPFELDDHSPESREEIRLQYRYLDLRRTRMKNNIIFRSKMAKFFRDFYDEKNFLEIETPILIKGTPEWSREYLVPSRLYAGTFYVLPQSPQQLKQLSMVAWLDKYFQMARCFRDEDQRGDRQPEVTQIDVEMSFVEQEDIMALHEELFIRLSEKFAPHKELLFKPFKRITWQTAMEKYGSDKPDLRYDLQIYDVTEIVKNCQFRVFASIADSEDGTIRALKIPGGDKVLTRKDIDELTVLAQNHGAKGLAYIQVRSQELTGPVAKFLSKEELNQILERTGAEVGDVLFFGADKFKEALEPLGQVRIECAKRMKLIKENEFAYLWVIGFPAFEKDDKGNFSAVHHPFTKPYEEDLKKYERSDLTKIKSHAYDLVLNGVELGGWSIRIHDRDLQAKMFELMKITDEDATRRFGHLLKAFEFGAPPHGGLAFWFDRILMLFCNEPNIREVIPFPKDQKAKDLMLGAPDIMPEEQLSELSLKIISKDLK